MKGPAAATLYGIQASNGVVRITTKKGSGRPKWNFFAEAGGVSDNNTYPLNFFGRDSTAATGADYDYFCLLQYQLDGLCTQTSVLKYTPLETASTRAAQDRLAPAVRGQRVGRQRVRHLLRLRRIRE